MHLPRPIARAVTALVRPTRLVAAAQAAVLTVLVAGATAWAVYDRTVTLEIDGVAQDVRILGTEVGDVLAAGGVEIGPRDLVSTSPEESIADGGTVVVRYSRPLTVTDPNGEARTYWTTELTVAEALAEIGIRTEGAWLSVSRSAGIGREGLDLSLSLPKELVLVADGETRTITSSAPTVGELLTELGIVLDADDTVEPAADTVLTAGGEVVVRRIEVREETETVVVEASTRTEDDDELTVGESRVIEEGSDGESVVTHRVVITDGKETSREEIERTVTTEPVERVVAEGTRETDSDDDGPPPTSDGLNWAALAQCESGGDPTIVSSNGLYHGLYQFDVGTWQSVGGSGLPSQASSDEQTRRAQILYDQRGDSPWPHCGSRLYS